MIFKSIRIILNKSCHRFLLEYHLKLFIKDNLIDNKNNLIVDFGCGNPRYKDFLPLSKWKFFDKQTSFKNVEFANEEYIPVENADLFICIEVLQYLNLKEISNLNNEINRIISQKGKAIISVPYLYPCNHKEYIRLRKPKSYFQKNKNFNFKYKGFGNLGSIIHDSLFQFIIYEKISFLKYIMLFILLPLKYISLFLEKKNLFKIDSGYLIFILSCK